jgi:hypothetical protein
MCTLHLIQLKCVDKQTLIGKDKIDVYVRGDRVAGPPQAGGLPPAVPRHRRLRMLVSCFDVAVLGRSSTCAQRLDEHCGAAEHEQQGAGDVRPQGLVVAERGLHERRREHGRSQDGRPQRTTHPPPLEERDDRRQPGQHVDGDGSTLVKLEGRPVPHEDAAGGGALPQDRQARPGGRRRAGRSPARCDGPRSRLSPR